MLNLDAVRKLNEELKEIKDPSVKWVVEYLTKRINEDEGIGDDILKEGKSLKDCWQYVRNEARKAAINGVAVIEDAKVYEWAEDYYRSEAKTKPTPAAKPAVKAKTVKNGEDDQVSLFDDDVDKDGDVWLF